MAVPDNRESERFFGVPLARRGIQSVWLCIENNANNLYRLRLDRNYYPPLEAAYACHFAFVKRIVGFGLVAWLFLLILPITILLAFKLVAARAANRRMNGFFQAHGIG